MDNNTDWIAYGYSTSLVACGFLGYLKSRRTNTIITGLIYGGLASIGAYKSSKDIKGHYLNLITSLSLTLSTAPKFYKTKVFIPVGMVCCLSIGMALRSSNILLIDSKNKEDGNE